MRVFGFLLGNSTNWPLMESIARASGGFYEALSNDDDLVSRLALVRPQPGWSGFCRKCSRPCPTSRRTCWRRS